MQRPKNDRPEQQHKAATFRALHRSAAPLILPNIWEPLGALMLEDLGYPAVATSSSAVARTHGYHDGEHLPFDQLLANLRAITRVVKVPVSADIEKGYAAGEADLETNIAAVIDTGVVGINFEDGRTDGAGLVPIAEQVEKIKVIRRVAQRKGIPLFINARVDAYLHGDAQGPARQLQEVLARGKAYKEAGADGLFAILLNDPDHIRTIKREVDLPLNIMVYGGALDMKVIRDHGVERISLGGSFLKIAMQAMHSFAVGALHCEGTDRVKQNPLSSNYLDALIGRNQHKE